MIGSRWGVRSRKGRGGAERGGEGRGRALQDPLFQTLPLFPASFARPLDLCFLASRNAERVGPPRSSSRTADLSRSLMG